MADRQITAVFCEIGCVTVYEILEEKLENMEGGSPAQIAETTTFSLLGLSLPSLVTVTQLDAEKQRLAFTVALAFGLVCLVAGIVVGVFWWSLSKKRATVFSKVRDRKKTALVSQGGAVMEESTNG